MCALYSPAPSPSSRLLLPTYEQSHAGISRQSCRPSDFCLQ